MYTYRMVLTWSENEHYLIALAPPTTSPWSADSAAFTSGDNINAPGWSCPYPTTTLLMVAA